MSTTKPVRTAETADQADGSDGAYEDHDTADEAHEPETYEIYRVTCPDCRQPIGLLADEETLPEHALCPTPWDPFGLTVCQGSGSPAAEAPPYEDGPGLQDQDFAALLTLPEGLDWRTQPFSHATPRSGAPARVPFQASTA